MLIIIIFIISTTAMIVLISVIIITISIITHRAKATWIGNIKQKTFQILAKLIYLDFVIHIAFSWGVLLNGSRKEAVLFDWFQEGLFVVSRTWVYLLFRFFATSGWVQTRWSNRRSYSAMAVANNDDFAFTDVNPCSTEGLLLTRFPFPC